MSMLTAKHRAATMIHPGTAADQWWRTAVIYQIYPRSFSDSDGDGAGDLQGITDRLPYLRDLGVDALWLSPFYPSPQVDGGYDISDHQDVDPLFGTLDDADELIRRAHDHGLRVLIDIVPNHTSDQHPWFREALEAQPGSPARDRYVFVDADGPYNNWPSEFGGPAWTQVADGQWYLHLFDPAQPDLNWRNPEVRELFLETMRFWLDRGVDGFRIDVPHHLIKADGLPDLDVPWEDYVRGDHPTSAAPFADQEGLHEIFREWRTLLESYPGQRAMVAEAWVAPHDRLARYIRPDEFHQAFNFDVLALRWDAADVRRRVTESYAAADAVGAPTTWVLSNHDVMRHASRLVRSDPAQAPWVLPSSEQAPDSSAGLRRARAATALLLALPGSAYLYQGEELGLPEVLDLPDEARRDPTFARTAGRLRGRDGCRIPLPWSASGPSFGFSEAEETWLPMPAGFSAYAADAQDHDPDSTLRLYRQLLRLRRERRLGTGTASLCDLGPDLLGLLIETDIGTTMVVTNFGGSSWMIPSDAEMLVSSTPIARGALGRDQSVWLAL